jgi:hypothetical protein
MILKNVPTYFKKEVETTPNIIWNKMFRKSSYTIPEGPLEERHDERAKTNVS